MAQNREPFLSRWSRRKRTARQPTAEPKSPARPETPPPELPPIDSLTPESDFSAFMHEQVDEKLRRAALRKLFSDPALNVVDGLDDYAEDFNQLETLAAGAAAGLEHAKRTLFGDAQTETSGDGDREGAAAEAKLSDDEASQASESAQEADATQDARSEAAQRSDAPQGDDRQNRQHGQNEA
ncbi:MAG: DUF3306 domain-containing protein [Burkholderiales bacterium]